MRRIAKCPAWSPGKDGRQLWLEEETDIIEEEKNG